MTPPQAVTQRSLLENVQMREGAGLMRYHSAPSSVLASFIHNEDFFCESIPHVDNSDLARILSPVEELCTSVPNPNATPVECFRADEHRATDILSNTKPHFSTEPAASNDFHFSRTAMHQPSARCNIKSKSTTGHLASIFEHIRDEPCTDFHISATSTMQVDMDNYRKLEFSLPKLAMPISASSVRQSVLATTKSTLIRHSSFPANFLSGRAMEACSERSTPDFSGACMRTSVESRHPDNIRGTHMQTTAMIMPQDNIRVPHSNMRDTHISNDNIRGAHFSLPTTTGHFENNLPLSANGSSFNGASNPFKGEEEAKVGENRRVESPLSINRSSLFRQSSSPAGFSSQSSFDGAVSGCEKGLLSPSSGSSSEDDRRGKELHYLSRMSGFWDEAGLGMTAFRERKRERETTEGKIANGLLVLDSIQNCPVDETLQWSFGHMDTSSGSLLSIDDSVLWRARAKRGCATHPRSIAERVRRTKISEGMRKLQELVPNMEKQTNIAAMLDGAVEYMKALQQQVQKLSENQGKCNGMCHSKGNT